MPRCSRLKRAAKIGFAVPDSPDALRLGVSEESLADWVWQVDADLRVTAFMSGCAQNSADMDCSLALTNRLLTELPWCATLSDVAAIQADLQAHRPLRRLRIVVPMPDNRVRYLDLRAEPLFALDGAFIGYNGTACDITDLCLNTDHANELAKRYRSMLGLSADWYWEMDQSFRLTLLEGPRRRADTVMLGCRPWEMPGVDATGDLWERYRNRLEQKRPFTRQQFSLSSPGGRTHWFSVSGEPRFDRTGQFTGYQGVGMNVSASVQREYSLRARESQYRFVIEHVRDVIYQIDINGRWVFLNAAWERLTGYSVEESVGCPVTEFLVEDDIEVARLVLKSMIRGGREVAETVRRYRRRDGGFVWMGDTCAVVRAEDGTPSAIIGTMSDITERIESENRRQLQERRVLLESRVQAVVALDNFCEGFGRVMVETFHSAACQVARLRADDQWECYTVLSAGSSIAVVRREQFNAEQLAQWLPQNSLHGGADTSFASPIVMFDNDAVVEMSEFGELRRMLRFHAFDQYGPLCCARLLGREEPFSEVDDELIRQACRIGTPLLRGRLDREVAEQARGIAEQGMAELSGRLSRALAGSNDGIYERRIDSDEMYLSPRFIQLIGYENQPIAHTVSFVSSLIHPDDMSSYRFSIREGLRRGRWVIDFRMRSMSDTYRWFRERGMLFAGERGIKVVAGVLSDIHEQKEAESEIKRHRDRLAELVEERTAKLAQARDEAERANETKSEFLANMSHELRTPMHAILSFAALGFERAGEGNTEKLRHYFANVQKSGSRLLSLLNDLLDLSKLESGKILLDLAEQDLTAIVEESMQEYEALTKSRRITLNLRVLAPDTRIEVDSERMLQVLRNLLSNAIKFSAPGSAVEIEIDQSAIRAGRRQTDERQMAALVIRVLDHGPGIPEDELERVFDKFVQSSKTKSGAGGTGLGLSICRQIVTAHRGRIVARNRKPQGAEFEVVLPRTSQDNSLS